MGIYHNTYFAYGARVDIDPYADSDRLEDSTAYPSGIGYLTAGAYDDHMSFIVAERRGVELGEFEVVNPEFAVNWAWNDGIKETARNLGVELLSPIGWLIVPSQY